MKLSEITTKDGETIGIGKFTLLVGPNNVGKSQTLKDIHRKLLKGHEAETTLIKEIKIDMGFVRDIHTNQVNQKIVQAIVQLANGIRK